ncbi:hypothetical protein EB796_009708 [Bugula neritina]|uniref:Uncharacterized protein n=1 Tax=Bugula neritina TaxID=10212 RepID=A0A7J7K331_BUGNE|nr:hypothetical protein EB796_016165 [Bugula neritina]KAF6031986.1 hypothetical protein EB796_009708 [Bugula neritina]
MTGNRNSLRYFLQCIILLGICCQVDALVNVTIYNTDSSSLTPEFKEQFKEAITVEAERYCAEKDTKCPALFQNANLSTSIDDVQNDKPNVNLTISIHTADDSKSNLPDRHVVDIIIESRETIQESLDGKEILSCNYSFFGIKPAGAVNWVLISVFAVFTIVLLAVVVYLSKHKVNPADEHYEAIRAKDSSVDGEIAT